MARRLASALLRAGRGANALATSSSTVAFAERSLPAAASHAVSVLGQQAWQHNSGWSSLISSRGFASESESAMNYAEDFDYISYPPPRAFVGQMAPDFEAPGVICSDPSQQLGYASCSKPTPDQAAEQFAAVMDMQPCWCCALAKSDHIGSGSQSSSSGRPDVTASVCLLARQGSIRTCRDVFL